MKIIFLDIDGVLNSSVYTNSEEYKTATVGMSDAEVMLTAHHLHLDPAAIKLLNDLVDKSGAEVVLSSTWRGKYSPDEMTEMLKGRGATFKIAASTPILFGKMSQRIPRGKEIGAYLKKLTTQPENYVILDDHDDMLTLKPKLLQTDIHFGLTQEIVDKALHMLQYKQKTPYEVVADWAKNKKRIVDRINRIKRQLKKYSKQQKHFEMRLKTVQEYEKAQQKNQA